MNIPTHRNNKNFVFFSLTLLLCQTFLFSQTKYENLNNLLETIKNNTLSGNLVDLVQYQYPESIVYLEYKYNPLEVARKNQEVMKETKISISSLTFDNPSEIFSKNGMLQVVLETKIEYKSLGETPPPPNKGITFSVFISENGGYQWFSVPITKGSKEYLEKYYPYIHEGILKLFITNF